MTRSFALFLIVMISLCASKAYLRGSVTQLEDRVVSDPSFLNLISTTQGQIPLKRTPHGFSISVTLPDSLNINSTTNTADMVVALYTNDTLLFNYNCSEYKSCHIDTSTIVNTSLPYSIVEGYYASIDASLDTGDWKLSSDAIVVKDEGNSSLNNSVKPYGIIGFGLGGNASNNLMSQSGFSIFLASNAESGQILFALNKSLEDSDSPKARLPADSNWHVQGVNSINIGSLIAVQDVNLIFDINSDAIGLPLSVYNQVLETLESQYGLVCSSDAYYQPVCSNYQYKKTLPDFKINIGDQSIVLPYSVYVQGGNADIETYEIALNLKALSSNLTGKSYVTPAYENYVVLNYHAMSYYYTVFDGSSQTIILYTANHSENMNYVLFLVLGWFGLFVVIALCYYCYIRVKLARQNSVNPNNEDRNSVQDPLIVNSQSGEEINMQVPDQEQQSFSQS